MGRAVPTLDDWLTTDDVAEHYNIPTRIVLRNIRNGRLPAVKKGWVYLIHVTHLPATWPPTAA